MKSLYKKFVSKVRNRETPLFKWLYTVYKKAQLLSMPGIPIIYDFFWYERAFRLNLWSRITRSFYYEPMFKRRYKHSKKGFMLIGGLPFIADNVKLELGENLTMHGRAVFYGRYHYNWQQQLLRFCS